jgi:hypothetical protein
MEIGKLSCWKAGLKLTQPNIGFLLKKKLKIATIKENRLSG